VETQTTFGKVGAAVNIVGSDLTGATGVTCNSGDCVLPSRTLSSSVPFRVP